MSAVEALRAGLPDAARDIKLNLQSVLTQTTLNPAQRWGVAIATAIAARNPQLASAMTLDAQSEVPAAVIDDAQAAAALMSMNNIYYRFRHMIGKPAYSQMPARLRMTRMAKPST